MKQFITAICILALATPFLLALETNVEETNSHLLLSVDCEGHLTVPRLDAQFDISKSVLDAFWEFGFLQSQFQLCDFKEKGCYSKFNYNVGHAEIYTIEVHLRACPNRERPEALITCIGDACSKLLTPCESSSDCGVGLRCPQKSFQSDYVSELMSELFSKIIFPDSNPTSTWQFCQNIQLNSSILRVDEQFDSTSAYFANRSQLVEGVDADDTIIDYNSNITILRAYCNGKIDLFGRSHNIGVVQRAVQTIQKLPPGFLKTGMDLEIKSPKFLTSIKEFSALQQFLDLQVHAEDTTKWAIYSGLLNETLIVKTNTCEAMTDVLIDVQVAPSIYKLLSIKGCSYHIECASVMCIVLPNMSPDEKNGMLIIRALYGIEHKHKGICFPWSLSDIARWSDSPLMNGLIPKMDVFDRIFNPTNKKEFNDVQEEDTTAWDI